MQPFSGKVFGQRIDLVTGFKKLKVLDLWDTEVNDAGCATLAAALDSGALPALRALDVDGIPSSYEAVDAVEAAIRASIARSIARATPTVVTSPPARRR